MTYGNIRMTWVADSTAVPDGYQLAYTDAYMVQTNTGTDGAWARVNAGQCYGRRYGQPTGA